MLRYGPGSQDGEDVTDSREVTSTFDRLVDRYDAWYDSPIGRRVFPQEVDAVQHLLRGFPRPWLEIGVGTGRFAEALGIRYGIDPSLPGLTFAGARQVQVVAGRGETLPFPDDSFGAIVLVVSLCFVDDPIAVLREARRVTWHGGGVILGLVLADSPWGRHYRELGAKGHPYYRHAHFFTRAEVHAMLSETNLVVARERSAIFQLPERPLVLEDSREGYHSSAGFTAILAQKFR